MQEPTFASLEFKHTKCKTRRERFLERIEALVPWAALEARVEPVYPKPGRGRRLYPLGEALLETINAHLAGRGLRLQAGTIVDASIIAAPSSTKNRARARDPAMHQTKKGNEWRFGMKLHIGVDAVSGLTHSLSTTAAVAAGPPARSARA